MPGWATELNKYTVICQRCGEPIGTFNMLDNFLIVAQYIRNHDRKPH